MIPAWTECDFFMSCCYGELAADATVSISIDLFGCIIDLFPPF